MVPQKPATRQKWQHRGAMPRTPRRVEDRIALRLPPELARRVREIAEAEKRSVNRQLELWIEAAIRDWEREHPRPGQADDR